LAKILAFFYSKQSQILKKLVITVIFEKNANFFAENLQKWQKIVIITSITWIWFKESASAKNIQGI
jgi:hypothetical protein